MHRVSREEVSPVHQWASDARSKTKTAALARPASATAATIIPNKRRRPDWSRPLRHPLIIPSIVTLETLADVRKLIMHLPDSVRAKSTWHYVAGRLIEVADGAEPDEVVLPLRMVLAKAFRAARCEAISAALDYRRDGCLLHRPRCQRPSADLRLLRGRARPVR